MSASTMPLSKPKPPPGPPPDSDVDDYTPNPCVYYLQAALIVNYVCGAGALFWPLFSMGWYGYGDHVYRDLSSEKVAGFFPALGTITSLTLLALVIFDVGYWKGCMFYVGRFLTMCVVVGYALTALVCTRYFAGADIAMYLIFSPALLYLIKIAFMPRMPALDFFWWVSISLLLVAIISGVTWLVWVIKYDNWWDTPLKIDYFTRLLCANATDFYNLTIPEEQALLDSIELAGDCTVANLQWMSPLVLTVWCLIMGLMLYFAVRAEQIAKKNQSRFDAATQLFITALLLGLMGMLAAAEIAGAEIGIASDIFVFCLLGMIIACASVVMLSGGTQQVAKNLRTVPLAQRAISVMHSDLARAIMIIFFLPIFFLVLPLSVLRQMGRRHLSFTKRISEKEKKNWFTSDLVVFLRRARRWKWAAILTRIIQVGFAFFLLSVFVARFFNVFFSWLNQAFVDAGLGVGEVTVIFYVTCVLLLLLPPTPGMPLFLASAVILVQVCMRNGWEFWGAWAYSCFIAFLVKISGFAGAQLLGLILGSKSVTVRRLVGVNSMELRAIKYILLEPYLLTFSKIGILLGGPDWPTAALAGMLKTSFFKNSIALIPSLSLIVPVSLTGAFWIRLSEGGLWASAAAVTLAIAIFVQIICMLKAVSAIEDTIQAHRAELDAYPIDKEVLRLDKIGEEKAKVRRYVSRWNFMPFWLRALMIWGAVFETLSAYAFELAGTSCFVNFKITSSIEKDLGGHAINLVKPMGWIAIAFCASGLVVLFIFGRWVDFTIWYRPDLRPKEGIAEEDEETAADAAAEADDEEAALDGNALKEKGPVPNEMQVANAILTGHES